MSRSFVRAAAAILLAAPAFAQSTPAAPKVPVRPLGPIVAASTEPIGEGAIVRGLPNGRVLVNAGIRQKVFSFDSTLKNFVVAMDSGQGLGNAPLRASALIPYTADSTIFVDMGSSALLVLDAMGATVRVMAAPRSQMDLMAISTPAAFGRASFDEKGRLFYRAYIQKQPPMTPEGGTETKPQPITADSSPIVRGDLDSRVIDTIAWVSAPSQGRMSMAQKPIGGTMTITIKLLFNPFQVSDEWALMTDGSIALVRTHDYHIDWVRPDGTKLSTPKMPFDWKRYPDEDKQRYADSIKTIVDSVLKVQTKTMANQPGAPKLDIQATLVPPEEWPDYYAPVKSGSVLADLENHLWILPTTSTDAKNGFTYDVVNRDGEIIERVQLPLGRVITGFGPRGMVYLAHTDGKLTFLERALIHPAGASAHSQ